MTFGFRKPVILLPAGFPHLDAAIQEAVLTHECLHVQRRDWLFTLMEEIVRAVFWFHPAIWWLLGEVQLAREQAVDRATVEMTKGREEYIDALLAIAGAQPRLDLAPAPLFLRKRHLKQRVVSILKEVRMSKTHSLSALAAGVCILAAACWLVAGAFPLAAAPQVVADGPGVSVELGGAALIHRPPVQYPETARVSHIEGTVVVEATLDSAGNPVDARVLSGPQELRKTALQSVLQWHFMRGSGATQQVGITFHLPPEGSQPEASGYGGGMMRTGSLGTVITQLQVTAPAQLNSAEALGLNKRALEQGRQTLNNLQIQMSNPNLAQQDRDALTAQVRQVEERIATLERAVLQAAPAPTAAAVSQSPAANAEMNALQDQMRALSAQVSGNSQPDPQILSQLRDLAARMQAMRKITSFKTFGLSESASQELINSLPVHVGDAATVDNSNKLTAAVKQFDEHLNVGMYSEASSQTEVEVRITAPGSEPTPRITVGGKVQEANLIKKVIPVYPPLARETRIQDHVVLNAIIGKDGTVQELKVVSGHPMLASAAMEAVRQWQYKPTLLNGNPVEVTTQIDINFTLGDTPVGAAPPIQ